MERDKLGRFLKGKSANENTQFKKGIVPWNKGLKYSSPKSKGREIWNKGKHLSKEHRIKIGEGNKGKKWNDESKIKFSATQQGISLEDWYGFKSTLNHRLRTSAKYNIWRNAIFLRDNFTCQNHNCKFCNNKIGVFLQAHHIKSIAEYPELMFRIDNGITYCEEFHLRGNLHKGIAKKQLNLTGGKIL